MEPIQRSLQKMMTEDRFQKRLQAMKEELFENEDVRKFLEENQGNVTMTMVNQQMSKLYEYGQASKKCEKCPSLGECINTLPGYAPTAKIRNESIELDYRPCPRQEQAVKSRKLEKLIQSFHMPKDIVQANMADLKMDFAGRYDAIEAAEAFISQYEKGKSVKGLYLFGQFGVGKSYLLGAIANELAERKQASSLMVYAPEFFREMKQSLADKTVDVKMDALKEAEILLLDDIGAESMSSWIRDEILGPILQYRMNEKLPTLFSSNFNFEELLHHLTYSQRGEKEDMKARRIMERIEYLSEPVQVSGPNLRSRK
ncbi:primosomal protein DnaI [Mangrovibacillus cuniculi]|uniref:Primosomal protein DnaI n=1 Tax=Mangrovibacillus cuniculi TaxID=2593652 RepID=A0A7S8CC27_9BACI|nr:primosomal protein DnaI [Mangrovibacillus cuniculi]QPC47187.1 primosomal protein DnaI [Mangrovibacillus cuniculi]